MDTRTIVYDQKLQEITAIPAESTLVAPESMEL